MKRQTILLLLSVLLLSGGAAAQSTKEQTLEDLNRTAALYYCYENHPRAARFASEGAAAEAVYGTGDGAKYTSKNGLSTLKMKPVSAVILKITE